MNNKETEYMKLGWDNNVQNCNINLEKSIMISDDAHRAMYDTMKAGIILGNLNIEDDQYQLCLCGKWYWLEFNNEEDAVAFKLKW